MAGEACEFRCDPENIDTIAYAHSGAVTKGDVLVVNDAVVIAKNDYSASVTGGYCIRCPRVQMPKKSSLAINPGDRVYWDNVAGEVNKTSTNRPIGWCDRTAAGSDTTVIVQFMNEVESSAY